LLTERARSLAYAGADPVFTRARHVAALRGAGAALASALAAPLPELRAEDLRLSVAALGRLTGAVDHDEILDVVFGAFCIGK
jgi:tRNA modification GTPase